MTILVGFPLPGAVAFHVHIEVHFDDFIRRKEAVANALLERVGVHRLAEVMDVGHILGFLGGGGESNLGGGGKVFKDFPPSRIFGGTPPMAFVNDDEVEEAGGKLTKQLLPFFRAGDGLVQPKVEFVGGVDTAEFVAGGGQGFLAAVCPFNRLRPGAEFRHGRAEGPKIVDHGLVDQHIAVSQKQDAFLLLGLPQPPDDLKGRVSLAGSGRHDQ